MRLEPFEEIIDEFRGCETHNDQIVVHMRNYWTILLPNNVLNTLEQVEIGTRIAILRTEEVNRTVRARKLTEVS